MNDTDKQNLNILTKILSKINNIIETRNELSNLELELEMEEITDTCVSIMEQYDHPEAYELADALKKNMDDLRIELDKRETK